MNYTYTYAYRIHTYSSIKNSLATIYSIIIQLICYYLNKLNFLPSKLTISKQLKNI